ncbi:TetR/AcrR family transcriptional regulator [Cellulomonas cellasea]|uniref:TetR family transcriptional regulator n=1 Tax=Cellulomonas cellasea DSM 20118 TaxID=1408250 RepID=A0A0A0B8C4_9CELL|nr:TetR/AcrR family transcriptional regulator [Cellulomonas cellasea]KGM02422.1 TetR family transcriptional regulator [Cellulomonas cellasea DSM 20118]
MTSATAPAPERTSAARERLLRAASRLFYTEGIHAVGVDRIVAEAQVTRATFYRHFPGKEELVVAYLRAQDAEVRARVGVEPQDPQDAAALLRAMVEGMGGEICRTGFRGCPFINAAAEYPDPAHPVHAAVVEHRAWLEGVARHALERSGHPDAAGAARTFMMLRDGAMVAGYLDDAQRASDGLRAAVESLVSAGGVG